MASPRTFLVPFLVLLLAVTTGTVRSELVLEEGYTVTTLIDGNKLGLNPHSILPRSSDFVVLDSAHSGFYTLSAPISQESVIEKLAGNGSAGFADGDLGSSAFNQPRSFAVDLKGNVYVADRSNHVIRKITRSGVSTIAGGYSKKPGHADGPAQHALFSNDFELTFVPGMCALLISDHGSMLIRQIDLKREDCRVGSHSVLGATLTWILGLGLSCVLGLVIGFVARPYISSREESRLLSSMRIWSPFRINLGKRVATFCLDIRSAVANSIPYTVLRKFISLNLSYLAFVFSFNSVNPKPAAQPVSLIDSDVDFSRTEVKELDRFASQLKDLITFDSLAVQEDGSGMSSAVSSGNHCALETMIRANLTDFVGAGPNPPPENFPLETPGLSRRKQALNILK
uniref:NHL repeat-containing protein n=1 Tax=Kalanchoe fedtschenkoi TaxID=63787 RepID=A0A7N0VFN8_KALFE